MAETCARIFAVLLLPGLAAVTVASGAPLMAKLGAWATLLVLAIALDATASRMLPLPHDAPGAKPPDWDVADAIAEGQRRLANVLPLAALLVQAGVLAYALAFVSVHTVAPGELAVIALALGISAGTAGISAAHELVHRRDRSSRAAARAFMLLVSYPHFPLVHLRVHHRYVGTSLDPGTSRLNETLPHFVARAYALSWRSSWRVECKRLRDVGMKAGHSENEVLRAIALQSAVYALVAWFFAPVALVLFVAQGVVAMLLTLAVDYTQHYGVVRSEIAPGRLAPVRPDDAWTTDHVSNRSTFNLGLHAAHHLRPGLPFTSLGGEPQSLQAPLGYPGLLLVAMVPPLWFKLMNGRVTASRQADA